MFKISFEKLNPLEREIHAVLSERSSLTNNIRITEAAELCGCSASKISKMTNKLGFKNYRQYLDFLYGRETRKAAQSSELNRIETFINEFEHSLVDDMVDLINSKSKIVLLGYGPSYLCAQYIEYRLKTCASKVAIATSDELMVNSIADNNTLLMIFTVTGSFKSFKDVHQQTKAKGAEVAIVLEEHNLSLIKQFDNIFCLTKSTQPYDLKPYEKNRTAIFIFMEEVVQKLRALKKDP